MNIKILQDFNNLKLIQTFRLFQLMICSIFQNINIMASSTDHPRGFRFSFSYLFILFRLLPIEKESMVLFVHTEHKAQGKNRKAKVVIQFYLSFPVQERTKKKYSFLPLSEININTLLITLCY